MCGIAAVVGPARGDEPALVSRLLDAIAHRGPDGRSIRQVPGATLGCVRLAIVDEARGSQPVTCRSGGIAAVANAEIYDSASLRAELAPAHALASASDVEVLAHLIADDPDGWHVRLSGMYAILAASREPPSFVAARDRFGIKPLYFADDAHGRRIFCSEIRPLQDLASPRGVVRAVRPGTMQVGDARQSLPSLARLSDAPTPATLRAALDASVARHLADRPMGVLLSGGLDSSLVAALARRHGADLVAYTVGVAGARDLEPARRAARALGLRHRVRVLTPNALLEVLPRVIGHLEGYDRYQVLCALPFWFLSEMVAEDGIKVVLCGEGSDELFLGYDHFMAFGREHVASVAEWSLRRLHASELQRVDRMTMAHGIEARVPFLDDAVAAEALAMPIDERLPHAGRAGGIEKWVLRRAVADLLPDDILWRPKDNVYRSTGVEAVVSPAVVARTRDDCRAALGRRDAAWPIRDAEEAWYFDIWREQFAAVADARAHLSSDPRDEIVYSGFRRIDASCDQVPAEAAP